MCEAVEKYFEHFNNQPYPVLDHLQGRGSFSPNDIPSVVFYPMLALSLRTFDHAMEEQVQAFARTLDILIESTWSLLTAAITRFEFDIHFFQGLCLLAQVDFATGNASRAQAQVTLGLRLSQSHGMLAAENNDQLNDLDSVMRREVVWTLYIMDRVFNSSSSTGPSVQSSFYKLHIYSGGPAHPASHSRDGDSFTMTEMLHHDVRLESITICALNIELVSIWEAVMDDIFHSPSPVPIPFWRDGSPRSKIVSRLLDAEMNCGKHKYVSVGPPKRLLHKPQGKEYYLSWLFLQLLHSTILCCLNHPFIIYIKTKELEGHVPLTFLQQSYEYSLIYSNWVLRLINDMQEAGLFLYDPFYGFMVTIAATIQLEQTLNKNETVANTAKVKFGKLREFLREMSKVWPITTVLLGILDELVARLRQRRTINRVDQEYDGAIPAEPAENVTMTAEDIGVMWKLFDYANISREYGRQLHAATSSSLSASTVHQVQQRNVFPEPKLAHESSPNGASSDAVCTEGVFDPYDADAALAFDSVEFNTLEHHDFGEDWLLMGRPWSEYFPKEF
ncbi:hypothetical protein HJFPF1_10470 [Paramyrothecium foliicola]|nr:hypothetical protein HJFPF1_10470 [Paramyrothecium foliicola]